MTRFIGPGAMLAVLFGFAASQASDKGSQTATASDVTRTVGVKLVGETRCVDFSDDPPERALRAGESLFLIIENKCGKPWNIRIDRKPNERFSKDCVSDGPSFDFETSNLFTKDETRKVKCTVKPRPAHIKDTYVFTVSGSDPGPATPTPVATDDKFKLSNLAVEVDP